MIGHLSGKVITICNKCAKPVPDERIAEIMKLHPFPPPRRHFCSDECSQSYVEPKFRCPECVVKNVDPCPHQDRRGGGDKGEPEGG